MAEQKIWCLLFANDTSQVQIKFRTVIVMAIEQVRIHKKCYLIKKGYCNLFHSVTFFTIIPPKWNGCLADCIHYRLESHFLNKKKKSHRLVKRLQIYVCVCVCRNSTICSQILLFGVKNQIEHSTCNESLLFCNCACSPEYSSLSTLAGLIYHICGKLEVPFKASPSPSSSSQHQHCTALH